MTTVHKCGWEPADSSSTIWVIVSKDKKQEKFHPFFSTGTAASEGDTPLHHSYHYYWEVNIFTETYVTDIMVGLAINKVSTSDSPFKFASLLGREGRGATRHDSRTRLRRLLSREHQRRPRPCVMGPWSSI